jgi:hypothetical protein
MQEIIQFLETYTEVEGIEFIEETENGYFFIGFDELDESEEEIEIEVTFTSHVYFNQVEQDLYLPFNVWSL